MLIKFAFAALLTSAVAAPAIADTIDFGQFGAVNSIAASPLSGFTADGVSFLMVGPTNFKRLDQGNGWIGQFTPGSRLEYVSSPGQIVMYFAAPISSLTNLAVEPNLPGSFVSTATAYRFGAVVDTSVRPGLSAPNGPGLLFPFALAAAEFDSLTFSTTLDGEGFALGQIAQQVVHGVPEPATWALLVAGFGMVGNGLRRRRMTVVAA